MGLPTSQRPPFGYRPGVEVPHLSSIAEAIGREIYGRDSGMFRVSHNKRDCGKRCHSVAKQQPISRLPDMDEPFHPRGCRGRAVPGVIRGFWVALAK